MPPVTGNPFLNFGPGFPHPPVAPRGMDLERQADDHLSTLKRRTPRVVRTGLVKYITDVEVLIQVWLSDTRALTLAKLKEPGFKFAA